MVRKMKDSGVEWIGEIPEDWVIDKNKHCFSCEKEIIGTASNSTQLLSLTTQGVKTKRQEDASGKVPESYDTYQIVSKNDLIMCLFDLDCSAVFSGLSLCSGMVSPAYKVLKCFEKMLPQYADYWFSFVFDGRKFKSYAKNLRFTLSFDEFGTLPIAIPSEKEQLRIASFLDSKCAAIDTVLAKTRESIEEYKKLKQAVITRAVTKGLNPDAEMKESGIEWIGKIPKDWNCIISRFVFENVGDIDHYMPESVDIGYPYLMIGDLKDKTSEIDFTRCKKISKHDFDELKVKMQSIRGDIIFARYATIGTVCYVDTDDDFLVSYACVTVRPDKHKLAGKYLFYYFKSSSFLEDAKQYINANTQGNVGIAALYKTKITVPPLAEQDEITEYLDSKCADIDALISKKELVLSELEFYKKSLIYEYVTGKKEVPETWQ